MRTEDVIKTIALEFYNLANIYKHPTSLGGTFQAEKAINEKLLKIYRLLLYLESELKLQIFTEDDHFINYTEVALEIASTQLNVIFNKCVELFIAVIEHKAMLISATSSTSEISLESVEHALVTKITDILEDIRASDPAFNLHSLSLHVELMERSKIDKIPDRFNERNLPVAPSRTRNKPQSIRGNTTMAHDPQPQVAEPTEPVVPLPAAATTTISAGASLPVRTAVEVSVLAGLKEIEALGDGNCAFNAFILAAANAIVQGELDLVDGDNEQTRQAKLAAQQNWVDFYNINIKEKDDPERDFEGVKTYFSAQTTYASQLVLQNKFQQKLRKQLVKLVNSEEQPQNLQFYQETTLPAFLAAFDNYVKQKKGLLSVKTPTDDIFIRCEQIQEEFKRLYDKYQNDFNITSSDELTGLEENDQAKRDLAFLWGMKDEPADTSSLLMKGNLTRRFLAYIERDRQWVGDLEIAYLGQHFGMNIVCQTTNNPKPYNITNSRSDANIPRLVLRNINAMHWNVLVPEGNTFLKQRARQENAQSKKQDADRDALPSVYAQTMIDRQSEQTHWLLVEDLNSDDYFKHFESAIDALNNFVTLNGNFYRDKFITESFTMPLIREISAYFARLKEREGSEALSPDEYRQCLCEQYAKYPNSVLYDKNLFTAFLTHVQTGQIPATPGLLMIAARIQNQEVVIWDKQQDRTIQLQVHYKPNGGNALPPVHLIASTDKTGQKIFRKAMATPVPVWQYAPIYTSVGNGHPASVLFGGAANPNDPKNPNNSQRYAGIDEIIDAIKLLIHIIGRKHKYYAFPFHTRQKYANELREQRALIARLIEQAIMSLPTLEQEPKLAAALLHREHDETYQSNPEQAFYDYREKLLLAIDAYDQVKAVNQLTQRKEHESPRRAEKFAKVANAKELLKLAGEPEQDFYKHTKLNKQGASDKAGRQWQKPKEYRYLQKDDTNGIAKVHEVNYQIEEHAARDKTKERIRKAIIIPIAVLVGAFVFTAVWVGVSVAIGPYLSIIPAAILAGAAVGAAYKGLDYLTKNNHHKKHLIKTKISDKEIMRAKMKTHPGISHKPSITPGPAPTVGKITNVSRRPEAAFLQSDDAETMPLLAGASVHARVDVSDIAPSSGRDAGVTVPKHQVVDMLGLQTIIAAATQQANAQESDTSLLKAGQSVAEALKNLLKTEKDEVLKGLEKELDDSIKVLEKTDGVSEQQLNTEALEKAALRARVAISDLLGAVQAREIAATSIIAPLQTIAEGKTLSAEIEDNTLQNRCENLNTRIAAANASLQAVAAQQRYGSHITLINTLVNANPVNLDSLSEALTALGKALKREQGLVANAIGHTLLGGSARVQPAANPSEEERQRLLDESKAGNNLV